MNPDKFGLNRSIVTFASNCGRQTETYDGVDVTMNARLKKLTLGGGWNIGDALQTGITAGGTSAVRANQCFVVDSPQQLYNCDIRIPFQNRFKFNASYLLPYDGQIATVIQSSSVVNFNSTYGAFGSATAGSVFRQPTHILDGRLVKFSFQLDF